MEKTVRNYQRVYTVDQMAEILFKDNPSGFYAKLYQLIAKADAENLDNLYKGFPDQVDEYCYYSYGTDYTGSFLNQIRMGV